ncbi:galectin-7-like [Onthophagus taurus]|uniref:galectin-7-like n=1 Tax=Onthophagus taurus TaxID=166361 RepID=UPI0039BE53C3
MSQTYIWPYYDILHPGSLIRIRGIVNKNSDRFHISLQDNFEYYCSNLIMRTSFRFARGGTYLVNNSKKDNVWMLEEMLEHVKLQPGDVFEVLILCEATKFRIALNKEHLCDYDHKQPISSVRCFGIHGDVTLTLISFEESGDEEKPIIGTSFPVHHKK